MGVIEAQEIRTARTKTLVRPRNNWTERSATRIYVWPESETVMENFLIGRRTRPVEAFRKIVKDEVLPALGLDLTRYSVKWSQKAGCSCGCSPGFILTDTEGRVASLNASAEGTGYGVCDISVTVVECQHEFTADDWTCVRCGLVNPEHFEMLKGELNEKREANGAAETIEEAWGENGQRALRSPESPEDQLRAIISDVQREAGVEFEDEAPLVVGDPDIEVDSASSAI